MIQIVSADFYEYAIRMTTTAYNKRLALQFFFVYAFIKEHRQTSNFHNCAAISKAKAIVREPLAIYLARIVPYFDKHFLNRSKHRYKASKRHWQQW